MKSKHSKYYTANPISGRLVKNFFKEFTDIYKSIEVDSVFDGGCGEGFVLHELNQARPVKSFYAIDVDENEVKDASRNLPFCDVRQGNLYEIPFKDNSFDLVICSEVLEHLEEPEKALLEIKRVSKKYVLLSVPNEPWFRISSLMSGKYLKTWGNHPEHVQNWTAGQFVKMVAKYFKVIKVETSFPWTIILCKL